MRHCVVYEKLFVKEKAVFLMFGGRGSLSAGV